MAVSRVPATRYSAVAVILHWLIAAAIVAQLASGLWMVDAIREPASQGVAFQVYQWHKSLGLTVLVLSLARLLWRIGHPPPPLPATMTALVRAAARVTHALFYLLMIGTPLVGWAMVSASQLGLPTIVFGLFEWPHISWLAALEDKAGTEAALKGAHRVMGYAIGALLALHVAAVLKHHWIDGDDVLARMLPLVRRRAGAASGE